MAWKPFSALPSYFGGKRALCPVIFREIGKVHPPRTWPNLTLLDPFMGGGSVSLYAKAQGFHVCANDLAHRCWLIGKGIIENNDRRLTDEDLANIAEGEDGAGFAQANYVPHYFNTDQARMIDRALAYAQSVEDETHQALIYSTIIRFINLIRIGGQISNQVLFRSLARGQFDMIQQPMLGGHNYQKVFHAGHKIAAPGAAQHQRRYLLGQSPGLSGRRYGLHGEPPGQRGLSRSALHRIKIL